jgi:serine O-acetyltransferase
VALKWYGARPNPRRLIFTARGLHSDTRLDGGGSDHWYWRFGTAGSAGLLSQMWASVRRMEWLAHYQRIVSEPTRRWCARACAVPWHAVRLYRLAHALQLRGHPTLALIASTVNRVMTGVDIEPNACFGPGLVIMHGHGLVVNGATRVGANAIVYQQVTLGGSRHGSEGSHHGRDAPTIGNNVTIYAGAKILGPVFVGDGAQIAANAVVIHDVPARAVVGGVPARLIVASPHEC